LPDRIGLLRLMHAFNWDREGWYLPLAEAVKGLSAREAAWQPPGGGNTIWQTLNHLNFYNELMVNRITNTPGGPAVETNEETFGATGDPEDEEGWAAAVVRAHELAERVDAAVGKLTEAELGRQLQNGGTMAEALVSWLMHDAYHTGQIVLLRKLQGSWPAQR